MKILKYELHSADELISRLRRVRLVGHGQPLVYENATICVERNVNPKHLAPAQSYVLHQNVTNIIELYYSFEDEGINIFKLNGFLRFWIDIDEEIKGPICLTPPIVEMSHEPNGLVENLINDGMHRVYTAKTMSRYISVVHISNVPGEYPYYAYPVVGGWNGVSKFNALPDGFVKKVYRDPERYKELFRDFNAVFEGVQEKR